MWIPKSKPKMYPPHNEVFCGSVSRTQGPAETSSSLRLPAPPVTNTKSPSSFSPSLCSSFSPQFFFAVFSPSVTLP